MLANADEDARHLFCITARVPRCTGLALRIPLTCCFRTGSRLGPTSLLRAAGVFVIPGHQPLNAVDKNVLRDVSGMSALSFFPVLSDSSYALACTFQQLREAVGV